MFFVGLLNGFAQEHTAQGIKYTVIAELKTDYKHTCDCQSLIISSQVFVFRVIKINLEKYSLSEINIVIPCPEGYKDDFFKKEMTYKIEFYENNCVDGKDGEICDYNIPKRKKWRQKFWMHSISIE